MFARQALRPVTLLTTSVRQYSSSTESGARWWHSTPVRYGLYGVGSLGVASLLVDNWRLRRHANAMEQIANEALVYSGERDPSPKVFTGGEQGFVPLTLESVADVNHNTKRFKFKFEDAKAVSGLSYCSALVAKHQGPESTKPVMRPYTPISHEGGKGSLELLIKKYPTGPMSSHIHSMKPGDTLEFKGPIPKYAWSTNKHEHVALIAGGTGITPMYQLCRAILENPFDKTKVTLVYGNLSKDDILLRDELRQMEQFTGGRFRMYHVLEKPPKHWPQGTGYITKEMLSSILPKPERGDDIKIFVCGPPPMYKAISGTKKSPSDQGELGGFLKELGYSKDQVYKF